MDKKSILELMNLIAEKCVRGIDEEKPDEDEGDSVELEQLIKTLAPIVSKKAARQLILNREQTPEEASGDTLASQLGDNLRQLRETKRMSRATLAAKAKVEQVTIVFLENGVLEPEEIPIQSVKQFTRALDLETSELKNEIVHQLDKISWIQWNNMLDDVTAGLYTEIDQQLQTISTLQSVLTTSQEKEVSSGLRDKPQNVTKLLSEDTIVHSSTEESHQDNEGQNEWYNRQGLTTPGAIACEDPEAAIVRIWNNDQVVGAGFMIDNGRILTCSHVITKALSLPKVLQEKPSGPIRLDFPYISPGDNFTGQIILWQPESHFAIIELNTAPPSETQALCLAARNDLWNKSFRTIGFPNKQDAGRWTTGLLHDDTIVGGLEPGFNGGPVWDEDRGCVIGMVTTIDDTLNARANRVIFATEIIKTRSQLKQTKHDNSLDCLHRFIIDNYSPPQLETMCKALGLPYAELLGKSVCGKTRSLLDWIGHNHQFKDLIKHLGKTHPGALSEISVEGLYQEFESRVKTLRLSEVRSQAAHLPVTPECFTGRNELLDDIKASLIKNRTGVPIALLGMGGVGKTALATKLAHSIGDDFSGGVFWGSLIEHKGDYWPILTAWAQQCCPCLLDKRDLIDNDYDLVDQVRNILIRHTQHSPALFILDGVHADWSEAVRAIQQALPPRSAILLTLRDRSLADKLGAQVREVTVLPKNEALDLLGECCHPERVKEEKKAAENLLIKLGPLPLAIEMAGRFIRYKNRPDYGLAELVQELEAQSVQISTLSESSTWLAIAKVKNESEGIRPDVWHHIKLIFWRSYEALPPDIQRTYRYLSIFWPGAIRAKSIAGVTGKDLTETQEHLDLLATLALVEQNKETQRYTLHTLLRNFVQSLLAQAHEQEAAQQCHLDYYLQFAVKHAKADRAAHNELQASLQNLILAFDFAVKTKNYQAIKTLGFALCIDSHFAEMRGRFDEVLHMLPDTAEACKRLGLKRDEARASGYLGLAHQYKGEQAVAIEYFEEARSLSHQADDPLEEGFWLTLLGKTYRDLGDLDKAFDYHQEALAIYRSAGDQRRLSLGIGYLGQVYSDRGQKKLAIKHLEEALKIAKLEEYDRGVAISLDCLGLVYRHLGLASEAIENFEAALAIYQEVGHLPRQSDTLNDIGLVYYNLGDIRTATEKFEEALHLSQQVQYLSGEAKAWGNLGLAFRHRGKFTEAIEHFENALRISYQTGIRQDVGNALNNLGITYRYLGQNRRAIELFEQSLEIRQVIGDLRGEGSSLGNLGICYIDLGLVDQATIHLEQALDISREVGERRSEGNALAYLGRAFRHKGQLKKSIEYLVQALTISEEIGHQRSQANRLGRVGNSYRKLGQPQQALPYLEKARDLSRIIEDERGEASHIGYLGLVYRDLGDLEKALENISCAWEMSRKLGNTREIGIWLGHLGVIYYLQGDIDKAGVHIREALEVSSQAENKRHRGNHLGNLGLVHYAQEQFGQAVDCFKQALAIHNDMGEQLKMATSLANLGVVYFKFDQMTEAITHFKQALDINTEINYRYGQSKTLSLLGHAYLQLNQPRLVIHYFEQALEISKEINNPHDQVHYLEYLASAQLQLNRSDVASKYKEEATEINKTIDAISRTKDSLMQIY